MKADSKSLLSQVIVDRSEDIAIIHLGSKEEKAVVLNESRMESLTQAIDKIHGDSSARGLVIVGAHESSFCAGADINAIEELLSSEMAERLALQGQELFSRIAALKIPTIAAISGPCVGGGFEMALACDYRIALDSSKTKIGLPEIKIGIVPGFGGNRHYISF